MDFKPENQDKKSIHADINFPAKRLEFLTVENYSFSGLVQSGDFFFQVSQISHEFPPFYFPISPLVPVPSSLVTTE